jgi:hypothetical protein
VQRKGSQKGYLVLRRPISILLKAHFESISPTSHYTDYIIIFFQLAHMDQVFQVQWEAPLLVFC